MLHHISFGVRELERSAIFYDGTLATLGYIRVWSDDDAIGYGLPGGEDLLCIKQRAATHPPGAGFHLALTASSHEAIQAFHTAALQLGGQDNGEPGLRPDYGDHYYAAFVLDPDGYALEAVLNAPCSC
ncbi:VOC family protein [Chitinimonas viridis]|uniref:VOC family protein n=1 Tax=Chitinimonas viridis TaxID=664880 RepID=A0ABT8B4I2_9NEIS|nr:VOC family protein [Chitinimonas viridis]MDN3576463.1 VOC family protein [Chitinimonas viridis]